MRSTFGTTKDGRTVDRIVLENGAIRVALLTYGATLQDVRLVGDERPLTLGSSNLSDYEPGGALQFFGPIVGPVANRIRNASTVFDGQKLIFEANGAGGHCLHGGSAGLHLKVWDVDLIDDQRVLLSTVSPDGEGGFPGNRRFEAEFALGDGPTLTLKLRATTDAPTLVNLANHSYWNLGSEESFDGHRLQISADRYLPADEVDLATGDVVNVDGTRFDFRTARDLSSADVLDTNFCLGDARGPLCAAASLVGPDGLRMQVETTEPGLQIYDAKGMPDPGVLGHDGRRYGPRCGLAIEAQFWPDAPSHPSFPSIRLEPDASWEQVTRFGFNNG